MALRSVLTGVGSHLPQRILTNAELAKRVDTSDEWIVERTGIRQRHIAADGERTSDLACGAGVQALQSAGRDAKDIDLIIVATTTPDLTFPATAARVQAELGVVNGAAFDLQAVCSGFIFALATADNFLARGQAKAALVIGAETFSRIMDWEDRGTCVLFGDGAGAVVLEAREERSDRGVISTFLRTDGRMHDLLYVDGGPSQTQSVGKVRMIGNAVFRQAVEHISGAMLEACARAGVALDEVDWFVPHQANQRILDGVARKLGIDVDKVVSTVALHGNTSAASVPLALDVASRDGRIKKGDLVLMEALGGGLTWGAALVRM
ncbi:beta-ketoacyl-ACP synthase III [Candidatus Viadribacter manganicus]|uniref:Beta-ketoacyl-[acyl-carrier-protein] synthase III n=1 Tax=Candidatus Viadribacter manganicus TaxID=1759059 RepID=A0A1B1ADI6_9PROT|nr:beta-ketoacyl-ACP synthase III [Candidatus Viadribacter manganicus]ANP44613.1 3-oxoacyl-ACP synthase [Candidatus Viadribacter manganicus]